MRYIFRIILVLFAAAQSLPGVVGDWKSYGSALTMRDLFLRGDTLHMASRGGMHLFDIEAERFLPHPQNINLKHIDLERFYINGDASEWYSYRSAGGSITVIAPSGESKHFDLSQNSVYAFCGNEEHVFALYKKDFTSGIVHFKKYRGEYIFQDLYNQFPGNPAELYDLTISGDSLYLAGDHGIYRAYVYHSNLKPAAAWTLLETGLPDPAVYDIKAHNNKLYFLAGDQNIYERQNGVVNSLLQLNGQGPGFAVGQDGNLYYATGNTVYRVNTGEEIYNIQDKISGYNVAGDTLWLAREEKGLQMLRLSDSESKTFIPNTMLELKADALAISENGRLFVCGIDGVSALEYGSWHNYVFSPFGENIQNQRYSDRFSADTLNIAYIIGGQTAVYDALVSSAGELFYSITDISALPVSGQSPDARGPGALLRINPDEPQEYTVYDTSDGIIVGTQELGGSPWYLKMRGLLEDEYANIYALNVHTLDGRPLIKFRPGGSIQKYSTEESGGALQILAREMVFDKSGRIWIANEERQSDIPRTSGGVTVFDPQNGKWALITSSDGLISNNVYSIDMDPLSGNIWVATASGVQMIRPPSELSFATVFSLNPPLDGLSGILAKKIRIDPRGNKWIITQSQGIQIYLNNNTWYNEGTGLRYGNSGLLDDVVYDLVFDEKEGYAYILTASGLNRFETAWTTERSSMEKLLIFPQPFRPGTDDKLVISGLAEQTQVSISTIDGRVLRTFRADAAENYGKQIIWDGKLANGNYIPRGVYLVFARNIDGLRITAKFAVE